MSHLPLFLPALLCLWNLEVMHPIHLSVTHVECKAEEKKTELIFRFFIDDFENSLNRTLHQNCNILADKKEDNLLITRYIKEKFSLFYDTKDIFKKAKLNRKEIDRAENSIKLYYVCESQVPKRVKMRNEFLNDLFRDQKNLLIFACRNTQEGFTFSPKKTVLEYTPK